MAVYHVHAKVFTRSAGHSAVAAASYRSASKLEDKTYGVVRNYNRKEAVVDTGILAPDNAPDWVKDRQTLWNAVEESEKRKDAQIAREVEFSLPKEMDGANQRKLARQYIIENFVSKGMVADYAIHAKEDNPHCHVMLTTREIGPEGFGKKERSWNDRDLLKEWRAKWAELANRAMMKLGIDQRIDHRTLKAQGIDRVPTKHRGPGQDGERKRIMAEIDRLGLKVNEHGQVVEIDPLDKFRKKELTLQEQIAALKEKADGLGTEDRGAGGSSRPTSAARGTAGITVKTQGRGGEQRDAESEPVPVSESIRRIRKIAGLESADEARPDQQADRGNKLDRGKSQDQQPTDDRDSKKRDQGHDDGSDKRDRTRSRGSGLSR